MAVRAGRTTFTTSCLILANVLRLSAQPLSDCVANSAAVLSTSSSPTWEVDREVFNERINVQPAGVAYARTEQEVQALLRCARASGVKAVPRGGGHGYEGYAVQNGALTIDISNLTSFQVDTAQNLATFGTGLRLGQLFLQTYEHADSLFPAGLCPWVGTAGHLLGGGTGMASRGYGLACDQIVGLTMVDYRGELITASASQNADLLWASCGGGGGNLGIVTSFTVRLHSLAALPRWTTVEIGWSGYDNAVEIFDKVQRWAPYADRRWGVQLLIGFGGVSLNAQYEGTQANATAALQQAGILQIPGTWRDNIVEQSWINATLRWGANTMGIPTNSIYDLNMTNGLPDGVRNNFQAASSYNQQLMSTQGIQTMVDAIKGLGPNVTAYAEHKMLLGAVSDVPANATAFYWRDSLYETQWMYAWRDGDQSGAASSWLNTTLTAMQPFVGQGAYINYPDPLLAATSTWPMKYYGGNLERYIQVKSRYDPDDLFSNPLTVRPLGVTPGSAPAAAAAAAVQVGGEASGPSGALQASRRAGAPGTPAPFTAPPVLPAPPNTAVSG